MVNWSSLEARRFCADRLFSTLITTRALRAARFFQFLLLLQRAQLRLYWLNLLYLLLLRRVSRPPHRYRAHQAWLTEFMLFINWYLKRSRINYRKRRSSCSGQCRGRGWASSMGPHSHYNCRDLNCRIYYYRPCLVVLLQKQRRASIDTVYLFLIWLKSARPLRNFSWIMVFTFYCRGARGWLALAR